MPGGETGEVRCAQPSPSTIESSVKPTARSSRPVSKSVPVMISSPACVVTSEGLVGASVAAWLERTAATGIMLMTPPRPATSHATAGNGDAVTGPVAEILVAPPRAAAANQSSTPGEPDPSNSAVELSMRTYWLPASSLTSRRPVLPNCPATMIVLASSVGMTRMTPISLPLVCTIRHGASVGVSVTASSGRPSAPRVSFGAASAAAPHAPVASAVRHA